MSWATRWACSWPGELVITLGHAPGGHWGRDRCERQCVTQHVNRPLDEHTLSPLLISSTLHNAEDFPPQIIEMTGQSKLETGGKYQANIYSQGPAFWCVYYLKCRGALCISSNSNTMRIINKGKKQDLSSKQRRTFTNWLGSLGSWPSKPGYLLLFVLKWFDQN